MLKVTVNGHDHELSPDSPRATSHSALLQDLVTAVNLLETDTNGVQLASTDAANNVITSASDNATTTDSVAAMTFHNTVAHATNDLEFNFTNSADTSLLKIDKEGDVTVAGALTATALSNSGTTIALSGATANVITSAASDANTTTAVAGLTFKNTVAHTAGDLEFNFQKSDGTSVFKTTDLTATFAQDVAAYRYAASSGAYRCSTSGEPVTLDAGAVVTQGNRIAMFSTNTAAKAYVNLEGRMTIPFGTAPSGTGIATWNDTTKAAMSSNYVLQVTVSQAALTAAATSEAITLWTVPAKTRVVRVVADVTAAFTGGGTTAGTVEVGIASGDTDAYLTSFDVFTAPVTKGLIYGDKGVALTVAGGEAGAYPNWSGTGVISALFGSATANVADFTTGSVTFYIEVSSYL